MPRINLVGETVSETLVDEWVDRYRHREMSMNSLIFNICRCLPVEYTLKEALDIIMDACDRGMKKEGW